MSRRILLITSNPPAGEKLSLFLAEVGYRVVICESPQRAVETIALGRVDAILCDENVGPYDSNEVARVFKNRPVYAEIPFIVLGISPERYESLQRTDTNLLADDFVFKPVTQAGVYGAITRWVEDREKGPREAPHASRDLDAPRSSRERSDVSGAGKTAPWSRGRVSPAVMARVFSHLARQRFDGHLLVKSGRNKLKASVAGGNIVDVTSTWIESESLGTHLTDKRIITPHECEITFRQAQARSVRHGELMVTLGLLTPDQLRDSLRDQKFYKLAGLFNKNWLNSEYAFKFERISERPHPGIEKPLSELIRYGLEVRSPVDLLWNLISKRHRNSEFVHPTNRLIKVCQFLGLDAADHDLHEQMFREAIGELRKNPALVRRLFLLAALQAVEIGVEPVQPPVASVEQTDTAQDQAEPEDDERIRAFMIALSAANEWIAKEEYRSAMFHVGLALQIQPDHPHAMAANAWCTFQELGRANDAVAGRCKEVLKKAISLDPQNESANLYLAKIFKEEGKPLLALTHFERVKRINPTNDEADREIRLQKIKMRKSRADTGRW